MKKTFLLITILGMAFCCLYSQDIIIKNNGDKISCEISREDSLNVYFILKQNNREVNTYLSRNEIQKIIYKYGPPHTSNSDSIFLRNNQGHYKGQILTRKEFVELLKTNDEAFKKYKSSKASGKISNWLAFIGGYCIGWPIGTAIGGGEPEWGLVAVGGGILVAAIPIAMISNDLFKEAVTIYNNGISKNHQSNKELKIGFTGNGIKLCLRF
jgi:hypothetical protein